MMRGITALVTQAHAVCAVRVRYMAESSADSAKEPAKSALELLSALALSMPFCVKSHTKWR